MQVQARVCEVLCIHTSTSPEEASGASATGITGAATGMTGAATGVTGVTGVVEAITALFCEVDADFFFFGVATAASVGATRGVGVVGAATAIAAAAAGVSSCSSSSASSFSCSSGFPNKNATYFMYISTSLLVFLIRKWGKGAAVA